MKMLAAILVEQNKPLVVDDISLQTRLDVGQVLVKINYSGICGSQIGEIQGIKGPDKYLPHLLGHEAFGSVLEIGPGVRSVSKDDKVVLHWRKGRGIDASPAVYEWNGRKVNSGQITTFSEMSVISENRLTKIHSSLDPRGLSLLGCAVTTGFGVICNNAKLKIGESLVVLGVGGVGLNIVEAGKLAGAHPIISIDINQERLNFSKRFGADYTISSISKSWIDEVRGLLPKADVVVDCTGIKEIIEAGYELTNSRMILVGVPKENISINSLPLHLGKKLIGSHGGESDPTVDIPRLETLATAGKINLEELVTEEVELKNIQSAIDKMIAGKVVGRCVVRC